MTRAGVPAAPIGGTETEARLDLRLALPALCGWAVLAWLVPQPPARLVLLGAAGLAGALLLIVTGPGRRGGVATVVALCLAAGGLLLVAAGGHRAADEAGPVPDLARERAVVAVSGTVLTEPRVVSRGDERRDLVVLRLRVSEVVGRGQRSVVSAPVVVFADHSWSTLRWRDRVSTRARLAPPDPGQDAVAALTPLGGGPLTDGELPLALRAAEHARQRLRESVDPLPADARGLIPGLVIGDTSLTPQDLTDAMLASGMTHLSAVSGSNVAIVLGAVVLVCGWCGVPRRWRPALALVCLAAFVVLCRPEPSVLRAGAMGAVGLLALSTSRRRVSLPALAVAVLALLCTDPWLARSYGFTLSTLATFGLVVLARPWGDAIGRRLPLRLRVLGDAVAIPLAAQVVCAPVIVLLQGSVSTVAVPANLLAAPLVAPTTIAGIVSAVLGVMWPAAGVLAAWLGALPAWLLGRIARWGATVPLGTIDWVDGPAGAWLLAGLTVTVLLTGPWLRLQAARHPLPSAGALAVCLACAAPLPGFSGWPPPGWVVAGCDVGQGDAFLVRSSPTSAVLVDVGPDPGLVGGCMDRLGVRRVDAVVLSHFHADHVAGLPGVLERYPVAAAYVSPVRDPPERAERVGELLGAAGVPTYELTAGHRVAWGAVQAEVVWPPPGAGSRPARAGEGEGSAANDGSVVMAVHVSGVDVLFTGDIELAAAAGVRRALGDREFDVLKVAHHGSATQDEGLVTGIAPTVALVGVGADNTFGHPAPSTLRLLARAGAVVVRTDRGGDVAVVVQDGRLAVAERGRGR